MNTELTERTERTESYWISSLGVLCELGALGVKV